MKSLLVAASLFIGFNAHAGYKAEVLANWFTLGKTTGVDTNGNACDVIMRNTLGMSSLHLNMKGMETHKTPRFNSFMSSELENINETATTLTIVVKSRPGNSYTASQRQTLNVTKTSQGTVVSIVEKEIGILGKTLKATCTIN